MRLEDALKQAVKYHAVAIVPTLVGTVIALVSLWIGVIDPLLEAIAGGFGDPGVALERALEAEYRLGIGIVGVVIGLLIRRIGRTTLLFRTHGTAVVEEIDHELGPAVPADTTTTADDDGADPSTEEPAATRAGTIDGTNEADTEAVDAEGSTDRDAEGSERPDEPADR